MSKITVTVTFRKNSAKMSDEAIKFLNEAIEDCKDKFDKRGIIFIEMPTRNDEYSATFVVEDNRGIVSEEVGGNFRVISMRFLKLHPEYESMKSNGKLFYYDSFGEL